MPAKCGWEGGITRAAHEYISFFFTQTMMFATGIEQKMNEFAEIQILQKIYCKNAIHFSADLC